MGSYSQAIPPKEEGGITLYCSGQIAIEPKSGKLITETIHKKQNKLCIILVQYYPCDKYAL